MKLVYLLYSLVNSGGMEKMLSQKASYLCDNLDYDVTVITSMQKGRPNFFPLSPRVKQVDIGINYHRKAYHRKLSELLCSIRPDVTVSFCGGELSGLYRINDGSVKVAEFHFSHDRFYYRNGHGPVHDLIARLRTERLERYVRRSDRFVVLTDRDRQVWEKVLGRPVTRINNFASFDPEPVADTDARRCISIGRYCQSKNHEELIRSWAIVAGKHPDWVLDIYGNGHRAAKLRKMVSRLGLEGKVNINKPTKNIKEEYASASMMLFTSLNEGFPLVVVEAASVGMPCVSYNCACGPAEIIQDSVTGYLVEPHDVKGFAERVCELIENPGLRRSMGKAAVLSCNRFSKEGIMKEWDSFFRSLV